MLNQRAQRRAPDARSKSLYSIPDRLKLRLELHGDSKHSGQALSELFSFPLPFVVAPSTYVQKIIEELPPCGLEFHDGLLLLLRPSFERHDLVDLRLQLQILL